jgi:hypothetical protein
MYKNIIRFEHNRVSMFLTSTECFTSSNPVYKAIQETLEEMGFKPECNHVFKCNYGVLSFTHEEVDNYSPIADAMIFEQIKHNRMNLTKCAPIISDLEYIFSTGVPAEHVGTVLKNE